MEIKIRRAVKEDCARLLELIQELADYEKASQEVTVTMEHFVESGFGAQPVWWAFVAEADGQVEGFAMYYIRYSTWKGQRMYLEDLIVTEKMRGKGLGKKFGITVSRFQTVARFPVAHPTLEWVGRPQTGERLT